MSYLEEENRIRIYTKAITWLRTFNSFITVTTTKTYANRQNVIWIFFTNNFFTTSSASKKSFKQNLFMCALNGHLFIEVLVLSFCLISTFGLRRSHKVTTELNEILYRSISLWVCVHLQIYRWANGKRLHHVPNTEETHSQLELVMRRDSLFLAF